ncbi:FAD-binding protein [Stenotrophomonas maltophilia]|uniref:FAD-binding protein n=1 Tax=Stenotrophomonas maltophilia TaxID=40324 RepID=UPI0021C9D19A|nr:FAD-binding protein [Stenotrophomonas maltophilia]MCU1062148.1 FAD-binding protein [Stenotrophomonas maltophilia]
MSAVIPVSAPDDALDVLTLLALKIAPRQFDLSYRFSNISIRDQIVRAQMLIQQLHALGAVGADAVKTDPGPSFDLLICGAGAAGLAAALEAERLELRFVLMDTDSQAGVGGVLRSPAARYVSAAMYEWPHSNHADHRYPLRSAAFGAAGVGLQIHMDEPLPAAAVGSAIDTAYATTVAGWIQHAANWGSQSHIRSDSCFIRGATLEQRSKEGLKQMTIGPASVHAIPLKARPLPALYITAASNTEAHHFRFVIYAMGYAKEKNQYAEGLECPPAYSNTGFWDCDEVMKPRLGFTPPAGNEHWRPRVAILGSGDGALQDALRCLLKVAHPLEAWDEIVKDAAVGGSVEISQAMRELATADMHATMAATWSSSPTIYKRLDRRFALVARKLLNSGDVGGKVTTAVLDKLRDDVEEVMLITHSGHFSKAYALNRFLLILLRRILRREAAGNRPRLILRSGPVNQFSVNGTPPGPRGGTLQFASGPKTFDLIIVRGGLKTDTENAFPHRVGLSGRDTGRAGLGRVPLPIRPPLL